jgi:hypothetical protein
MRRFNSNKGRYKSDIKFLSSKNILFWPIIILSLVSSGKFFYDFFRAPIVSDEINNILIIDKDLKNEILSRLNDTIQVESDSLLIKNNN